MRMEQNVLGGSLEIAFGCANSRASQGLMENIDISWGGDIGSDGTVVGYQCEAIGSRAVSLRGDLNFMSDVPNYIIPKISIRIPETMTKVVWSDYPRKAGG